MAIKKFSDFESTQAYTESIKLPRGGYVCKIAGAKIEENQRGQYVKIAFDIYEGEFAKYYQNKFEANTNEDKKWPGIFTLNVPLDDGSEKDGWTKRRFKTFTNALEDSNPGYHFDWDETKFKGKLVGLVFNYREYEFDGQRGMIPNPAQAASVNDIRENKYKIPKDRMLSGNRVETPEKDIGINGFVSITSAHTMEEIPY